MSIKLEISWSLRYNEPLRYDEQMFVQILYGLWEKIKQRGSKIPQQLKKKDSQLK